MEFEWHETKRQKVLRERQIDFVDIARAIFDGRPIFSESSPRGAEERFISIALLEQRMFAVVWTMRGDVVRIISARRARNEEVRKYRALHG